MNKKRTSLFGANTSSTKYIKLDDKPKMLSTKVLDTPKSSKVDLTKVAANDVNTCTPKSKRIDSSSNVEKATNSSQSPHSTPSSCNRALTSSTSVGLNSGMGSTAKHKNKKKVPTNVFYTKMSYGIQPKKLFDAKDVEPQSNTHCVVQWLIDESFGLVSLKHILRKSNEELELDGVYDVKYGREVHKATLKIIGSIEVCNQQILNLTEYECVSPKSKDKDKTNTNANIDNHKLYESKLEIQLLQEKLLERDDLLKERESEIETLKQHLEEQYVLNESYKDTFSPDMMEKFVVMSKNFLQLFATEEDLQDLDFSCGGETYSMLTPKYQNVKVVKSAKIEMDNMMNNSQISDSSVFRRIIQTLIPDEDVWFDGNRAKMFTQFNDIIYAAFTYIGTIRTTFSFSECKTIIRQICNETRRKVKQRKRMENIPNTNSQNERVDVNNNSNSDELNESTNSLNESQSDNENSEDDYDFQLSDSDNES